MGTNQSTSPLSSKSNSTANSSNCTPEKEKNTKISPEELIQSAAQVIETSKRIVKEINEAQYTTYSLLEYPSRISKQFSVAEDLRFFINYLENNLRNTNSFSTHNWTQFKEKQAYLAEQLQDDYNELLKRVDQVDALLKLSSQARSSFTICQNLILKSSQLIEYIEILESREKKAIKQKGLKKQLDQAQCDLNDTSLFLEQLLLQKIQVSSIKELDDFLFRLNSLQQKTLIELQKYQSEEREEHHEIPYELE